MTKHACGRVPWRENDKMQRRRPRRRRMDTYVRGGGAGAACAGAGAGRDQSRPAHCRVVDRSGQGQPSSCCNIEPSDRCAAHVQEICVSSYPPTLLDWWFVRSGRIEHVAVTLVHVRARSSTTTRASERVLSYWLVLHSGRGARGGRPAVRPIRRARWWPVVVVHTAHTAGVRAWVGPGAHAAPATDDSACGQLATSYSTSTLSERANAYICTYVSSVTLASTPRAPQYACTGCTGARRPGANIASHTCSLASEPCTQQQAASAAPATIHVVAAATASYCCVHEACRPAGQLPS